MLLSEKHYFPSSSSYFYSILYGVHTNFLFTKESFVNNNLPQQIVFFSLSLFFFFLGEGVIFVCLFSVAFFLFPSFFDVLLFFYVLLLCLLLLDHSEGSRNKEKKSKHFSSKRKVSDSKQRLSGYKTHFLITSQHHGPGTNY